MVERIEGFCTQEEWKRAYKEINDMEKDLADAGAVVLKFWMQIDKKSRKSDSDSGRKIRKSSGRSQKKTGETVKNGSSMRRRSMRC